MLIGSKPLSWMLGLVLLAGCTMPVREEVDRVVCDMATQPVDLGAFKAADTKGPEPVATPSQAAPETTSVTAANAKVPPIPKELPSSNVRMLDIPPTNSEAAIKKIYPPLPPLGPDPQPEPAPEGRPWTLTDLQRIALASSPLIRQAVAAVKSAEGAAVTAGLPPNPNAGYEGDVMGTGGSAGLHGAWFEQVIKTAGKLKLAQAAALMEVLNAQLALQKARADLAYNVRNTYFMVLVARRNLVITRGLVQFTDELYRRQVELVLSGSAAPYEPAQLRASAWGARATLVIARNRVLASWKELASAMGRPDLPMTEVAGEIDVPLPIYEYAQALQWVLQNHTDVRTAENSIRQARYNLSLAQVAPFPDVNVRLMVQKDNTTLPHEVVPSLVLGVPLPLWNRNQGGIKQAQGNLMQQIEEPHRVRSALVAQLAEAFQRYRDGLATLEIYQNNIIPDQMRAYLHIYERHLQQPEFVGFGDIIVAQQLMAGGISTYITTLGNLWTAVADISHLLQTNDLYHIGDGQAVPTWDVPPVPTLPCCHPCSPLAPGTQQTADGAWPLALPRGIHTPSPSGN